jgi:hypothetical protein
MSFSIPAFPVPAAGWSWRGTKLFGSAEWLRATSVSFTWPYWSCGRRNSLGSPPPTACTMRLRVTRALHDARSARSCPGDHPGCGVFYYMSGSISSTHDGSCWPLGARHSLVVVPSPGATQYDMNQSAWRAAWVPAASRVQLRDPAAIAELDLAGALFAFITSSTRWSIASSSRRRADDAHPPHVRRAPRRGGPHHRRHSSLLIVISVLLLSLLQLVTEGAADRS